MYKVMIIDDEPWVLARLRGICDWEEHGFRLVSEEADPADAWQSILKQNPDVVFTDINMPGTSGLDILEKARALGIDAEFVIISGYDEFSFAQRAIAGGVFHYLLKPVEAADFKNVLVKLKKKLDKKAKESGAYAEKVMPVTDSQCLNSMLQYIGENYTQPIGLAELSREFFVSQTYICDLFNKYMDTTFVKYLNTLRLEQAKKLLEKTQSPVSLVALETGFKDYSYFSKMFRKYYGLSPSEYRSSFGRTGQT